MIGFLLLASNQIVSSQMPIATYPSSKSPHILYPWASSSAHKKDRLFFYWHLKLHYPPLFVFLKFVQTEADTLLLNSVTGSLNYLRRNRDHDKLLDSPKKKRSPYKSPNSV